MPNPGLMTIKSRIIIFALFIICLLLKSDTAGAARVTRPNGPYGVGYRIEHLEFEGRTMAIALWYPAEVAASARTYEYAHHLFGSAVAKARPARSSAPYPLIIYSHGGTSCGIQSLFFTENLASYGYLVVAPDHQDSWNCSTDSGPEQPSEPAGGRLKIGSRSARSRLKASLALIGSYDWRFRIKEISATIDYLLLMNQQAGEWQNSINPLAIGVAGHSIGGWDALVLGGVEIHCERAEDMDPQNNKSKTSRPDRVNLCNLDGYRGKLTSLRDPRVKAVLALSPSVWVLPNHRGEAASAAPVMIISGEKRDIKPKDLLDTYNHLPAPRYLLLVRGADHRLVEDLFAARPWYRPFYRSAWFHYQEKQEIYMNYSANFFNAYLKGDPAGKTYISGPHSNRITFSAKPE